MVSYFPQAVAKTTTTVDRIRVAARKAGRQVTFALLKDVVMLAIDTAHLEWQASMQRWVDNYVPMDTGALRADIVRHLKAAGGSSYRKVFTWGTDMSYVKYVNKMPATGSPHLQHPIDPKAQPNFMGLGRIEARRAAKAIISRVIKAAVQGTPVKAGTVANIMRVSKA